MTFAVSPPRHAVEMRAFGSLDLRTASGDELRPALAQGKRMALLCYLALASPRGFHRRDTLVGLFWSEVDQQRARAALRQALHFLRQSVGQGILETRGSEEIALNLTHLKCDVLEFEEQIERGCFESAVQLYKGPLLNGHFVSDAPEFERWLDNERDRLARMYADALSTLANSATDRNDPAEAVSWWRRLASHDPYRADVACQLISALDAAGDRAAAIAHAHAYADSVRNDLEVEPHPEVLELAVSLRNRPSGQIKAAHNHAQDAQGSTSDQPRGTAKTQAATSAPRRRRTMLLGATVPLIFVCAVVYAFIAGRSAAAELPDISLAVLPFENLGPATDDYLVAGLADDIVHRLAGLHGLNIIGPIRGDMSSPGDTDSIVGGDTETDFLLRASVERIVLNDAQAVVRVIPSLIRVADGTQMWTETIEHELTSLFSGQVRIAEEITRLLQIRPLSTEREWLRATPTSDVDAFDMFLRGDNHLSDAAGSRFDATRAVDLFELATTLDTAFVEAHAKLAIAHTSMYWWNHDRSPERLIAAKAAADHAVRLRADMPIAHLAMGWYYYWGERDYDRALRHFELARANWPGISEVLILVAGIRRRQGDFDRSLENHREAALADPYCATCFVGAAFTHLLLRDYSEASRYLARAEAVAPDLPYASNVAALTRLVGFGDVAGARQLLLPDYDDQRLVQLVSSRWGAIPRILGDFDDRILAMDLTSNISDTAAYYLAKAELTMRRVSPQAGFAYYDSARAQLEGSVESLPDDPQLRSRLGLSYAGLGRRDDALREGTESVRLRPIAEDAVDGIDACEALARIHTMLGDFDSAIDRIEMLLSVPSTMSTELLRLDPIWDPLRQHPRFLRLFD